MDSSAKHDRSVFAGVLLGLIVVASLIPDIGVRFATFGFTWTFYRFAVPVCLLFTCIAFCGVFSVKRSSISLKLMLILLFWIGYGVLLLFTQSYVDRHAGFIELLSIVNGLIVIVCFSQLCTDEDCYNRMMSLFVFVINLLLLLAIFEIVTGKHLPTSFFNDKSTHEYDAVNIHSATGFMYNINDFSAMLTCFVPVLLLACKSNLKWISIFIIVGVNLINDATTCNLAIIICLVVYFIFDVHTDYKRRLLRGVLIFVGGFLCLFLLYFLQDILKNRGDVLGALAKQISNAKLNRGSLYKRSLIYKDSIIAGMKHNFIGYGPSSFTNYFSKNKSLSYLSNPHSLIFEILFQYGIIVFVCYMGILFAIFRKAIYCYNSSKSCCEKRKYMLVFLTIIAFFMVSFAPSSFLNYSYQWIILALCCTRIDLYNEQEVLR